ncbi:MAG: FHA domain-containing protein, partial [Actinomycetota bacterium]
MASLIVRDGPMRGRRIEVGFDEVSVGREDTDLVIEDDTEVSRSHAVVRPVDGGVEIEDLDSTNGTFVNELKISGPTRLSNGDIIRVGQTRLDVAVEDDPNATSVSSIVVPPTSPTDLPIPVQRVSSDEPEGTSDAEADSEMRAPTSELPSRQRVGGGAIQRGGSKRGLLVALGVVVVLVAGYLLYSLIAGGAPSKQDYVVSVNDICEPEVSKLNNLRNVNRARSVQQGSRLVNGMVSD